MKMCLARPFGELDYRDYDMIPGLRNPGSGERAIEELNAFQHVDGGFLVKCSKR